MYEQAVESFIRPVRRTYDEMQLGIGL